MEMEEEYLNESVENTGGIVTDEIPAQESAADADGVQVNVEESMENFPEFLRFMDSISGNTLNSVSGNVVVDNYIDYSMLLTDMYAEVQTLKKEDVPIWEKPLEDYTVTEGLLLLVFVILLAMFIGSMFKRGEHYV